MQSSRSTLTHYNNACRNHPKGPHCLCFSHRTSVFACLPPQKQLHNMHRGRPCALRRFPALFLLAQLACSVSVLRLQSTPDSARAPRRLYQATCYGTLHCVVAYTHHTVESSCSIHEARNNASQLLSSMLSFHRHVPKRSIPYQVAELTVCKIKAVVPLLLTSGVAHSHY